MVHIVITGCNGQLGSELRAIARSFPHFGFTFTDVDELNITDKNQVESYIHKFEPDVIVNCAGYTAVDKAEDEPEQAMWLNRDGVANLTCACEKFDCYLVHISTDFIFDGKNSRPYREDDIPSPVSVYGMSKLAGEEAMMSCLPKGLIIRTSWLYSSFGNNFVKTILKKCAEKRELNVVSDQMGSPTYARDLAKAILDLLPAAMNSLQFEILNYSNEGKCSWFDFACEIMAIAGRPCRINPVSTDGYPSKAKRPAYSVLDKSLIKAKFGITIPKWQDSLRECLGEMGVGRRA